MNKLRHFGGTPVAEGVRVEVGRYTVFAVRKADGDIAVRLRSEPRGLLRAGLKIPFVRGIVRLFRDIVRYLDGIAESAELNPRRAVRGNRTEQGIARFFSAHPQAVVCLVSALAVIALAPVLLYAAPQGLRYALNGFGLSNTVMNLLTGIARALSLLLYVYIAGHLRIIERLGMYRGALNKAINCYECRDDMITPTAMEYPRIARRSEAAYVLSVACLSMIAYPFIPFRSIYLYLPLRVGATLVIAALFNEFYRVLENADPDDGFARFLRGPMELMQLMTSREPSTPAMEVAVCAFQTILGEIEEVKEDDNTAVDA